MGWRHWAAPLFSLAGLALAALAATGGRVPQFVDIGAQAGLSDVFYCGSDTVKKYIIEALGNGVALIDYDNDGYPDVFFVTASRLDGFPAGQEPTNRLYHNNRNGTFTDVTRQAGLDRSGW